MKSDTERILWDFRLFSTGYADRGIGTYCRALCEQLLVTLGSKKLFILGEEKKIPQFVFDYPIQVIPFKPGSWKRDLFRIPYIILKYRISIIHYWVLFGPLRQCGIGLFHPCKTIATVHDLGIEYWNIPYLHSMRATWYWRVQKSLARSLNSCIAVSNTTKSDCIRYLSLPDKKCDIAFISFSQSYPRHDLKRLPYFVALSGGPHKNSAGVAVAFKRFREKKPNFTLLFLGEFDDSNFWIDKGLNIHFEQSMSRYTYHLQNATALLFCSFYEGLGIPPLEALQQSCPVIVSDIPSLKETCSGAALFVDPSNSTQIADAMLEIAINTDYWSEKAYNGSLAFAQKSSESNHTYLSHYRKLIKTI